MARDPNPAGVPLAQFANDPRELPMQYDLYRIPFREGKGGRPEPIAGASRNGRSNSFPKISPDGRWIVFVEARNGLLMRPDSQLYIVSAGGGEARRMHCNTPLMNSWHSFSPKGRWLVFSSKARSPYTQMYLTHIDEDGNDSPPILIDNATAANRAVNLPEFVNVAPDGLRHIGGPVLEYYQRFNSAVYREKRGDLAGAIAMWKQVLDLQPDDARAQASLGGDLLKTGHLAEAGVHLQTAAELKLRAAVAEQPRNAAAYRNLGRALLDRSQNAEAEANLRRAVELDPASAGAHCDWGVALARLGKFDQAAAEFRRTLELDPRYAPGHYHLGLLLDQRGDPDGSIRQWREALTIDPRYEEAHDSLAAALYARGQAAEALAEWRLGTLDAGVLRQMAWAEATSADASIRNGPDAIALAVKVIERSGTDAEAWDALAAAYAEAGRFADALPAARRAREFAQRENRADLLKAIEGRLRLYQQNKPFRSGG